MSQYRINKNVDYLYGLHIKETEHQNHRLSWILAAQALIFTGLCTLLTIVKGTDIVMIAIVVLIGILLSISGVYSVIVGEASNSVVMGMWNEYDSMRCRRIKEKPIPHLVTLAPEYIMKSSTQFLLFCRFAPNVFCAAWITLSLVYLQKLDCLACVVCCFDTECGKVLATILFYLLVLSLICLFTHYTNKYLRYKWGDEERKKHHTKYCLIPNQKHKKKGCRKQCCNVGCCCQQGKARRKNGSMSNMRIYHIMVDRFNGTWTTAPANQNKFLGGNLKGVIDKLDYIQSLGYNAIMLTPIYSTDAYHGYHITDYSNIDTHFGDWSVFAELVKEAHGRNMKVICDFVPNHCHASNPIFQDALNNKDSNYRGWFYFDASRKGDYVSYQNYPDLPKFNLYNKDAADYMISRAVDMINRGVDGLRIDHAVGAPFDFLRNLRQEVKRTNHSAFVFGEVWATNPRDISQIEFINNTRKQDVLNQRNNVQELMQLDYEDILDGVLDFEFREIMQEAALSGNGFFGNKSLQNRLASHFSRYKWDYTPILFLDNHDTNRFMYYCNNNRALLDEAVHYMRSLPYPSIVFYGTEQYMVNAQSIHDGDREHADMDVREPMNWA